MNDIAIKVDNLSKLYRLNTGKKTSLSETIASRFNNLINYKKQNFKTEDFWALNDLSFEIKKGEAVGIIGKNGAGKSTLLKVLSRITEPTSGRVEIDGRVASLLEVGTGFHPELTGRENIFLNGTILGMKRHEIKAKLDQIVAFSGIEKFVDTPVKRYSSGMYVRLAFAVAAHLEPEVLIIDEVLAVGDLEFQNKCLGKMKDVVSEGRTVLFVSHNMHAVNTLTKKCIFLDKGKVFLEGDTSQVISAYIQRSSGEIENCSYRNNQEVKPENYIESLKVNTSEVDGLHYWGEEIVFEFVFYIKNKISDTGFSFQIVNGENIAICHFSPTDVSLKDANQLDEHRYAVKCVVPKLRLFMGKYRLVTWLADNKSKTLMENIENICEFEISMLKNVRPNYDWKSTDCTYLEDYYFK